MKHQIHSYLNFLLNSKNQHGVHSPFVYKLVTQCFYDKSPRKAYKTWKLAKLELLNDKTLISVEDFGAGSRVFKTNQRAVNQIAKNVGITQKRAQLLNRICSYLKIENALELGTSLGLGSLAMTLNNHVKLDTVEACPNTLKRAEILFKNFNFTSQISTHKSNFNQLIKSLSPTKTYDLIYIDGHHNYEATWHYFNQLKPHAHDQTIFIFDDIHWSKEMTKAWQDISNSPEIHVSIDTFYWGICFKRPEQAKEHFRIRI